MQFAWPPVQDVSPIRAADPARSAWLPASCPAILGRLADSIGIPLVCLDRETGQRIAESQPGILSCVPAACLLRLAKIAEPEVFELSQGLLAFVGPLPGIPDRRLHFAGVALSERHARPAELVLAAIEANWSNEQLDDWLAHVPVISAGTLERLVRLACQNEQQSARLRASHLELDTLGRQVDAACRQISLFHTLAPFLQLSERPENLARACLERLSPLLAADCHLICLDLPGSEPLLLIGGELPFEDTALLRLIARFEDHDWSTPLIRNRIQLSHLASEFPGLNDFVAAPIQQGGVRRGWMITCNEQSRRGFGPVEAKLLGSLATVLGVHLSNYQLFWENDELLLGFVKSLVTILDARDPYTRGHSERVALIARQLAMQLGLSVEDQELIYLAGLLHDIGKLGIDIQIIRKEGPLTRDERDSVQQHPELGCQILRPLRNLQNVLPGIRHHHEMWDGTGYPAGLKGKQIPQMASIVAVADAFDAMTSDRPYRPGLPPAVLQQALRDGSGVQWDPDVVEAFFAQQSQIQQLCRDYSPDHGNLLRELPAPRGAARSRSVLRP